jgi:hypothetical protein
VNAYNQNFTDLNFSWTSPLSRTSTTISLGVVPLSLGGLAIDATDQLKGEIPYFNAGTGAGDAGLSFIPNNTSTTKKVLKQIGNGSVVTTTQWEEETTATITGPESFEPDFCPNGQVLVSQDPSDPECQAVTDLTGSKPFEHFYALQATLPGGGATTGTRNNHQYIAFDAATDECVYFEGALDVSYASNGLEVDIDFMAASATSGSAGWLTAFEAYDGATDLDSDSFGTQKSVSQSTAGTSGITVRATTTHSSSEIDSIAAGWSYRLRICRDGDGSVVTDSMTGDAQVLAVIVREPTP